MVTAPKSGAEAIPFIKTYVNLPTAIVRTSIVCCVLEILSLDPLDTNKNEKKRVGHNGCLFLSGVSTSPVGTAELI